MAHNILERLRQATLRMHRDEGGAIVMLCFAGCVFLFMVSLIVFDAGYLSRDKIDAQTAADTAGYSDAAVKARAMNMIAFANVGKRTIVGIRNMYFSQYPHYMKWLNDQCDRCCCGFWCGCWGACFNCIGNWMSLVPIFEGIDYAFFMIGRFVGDDISDYLSALDKYQKQMVDYASYWGLAEGIVRGVRNGANIVTSYPLPDNSDYGKLPLKKDNGLFAAMESCLAPTWLFNPSSLGTLTEWSVDFKVLKERSVSRPFIASQGPRERVRQLYSYEGCLAMINIGIFRDVKPAIPYHLTATGNSGEDYMKKSNIIWAYRYNPDYTGNLRKNYNAVIPKDYQTMTMGMPYSGLWAMARGEIYYPPSNLPNLPSFDNPNGMWMFHPSWIGKLRPVVLKGEDLPVEPSKMWKEASRLPYRESWQFGVNPLNLTRDMIFMKKASKGMDGKIQGKEVLDGIPK